MRQVLEQRHARPPSGHGPPVSLVLGTISPGQCGLLIPPDERGTGRCHHGRVAQQDGTAEQQGLADDDGQHGHIHGIADVTVQPAHHQLPGRRGRGRGTVPLQHELCERGDQRRGARRGHRRADDPDRDRIIGAGLPSGQPPGNQPGHHPGRDHQEDRAARDGCDPPHWASALRVLTVIVNAASLLAYGR
jgi:hypothetical protein